MPVSNSATVAPACGRFPDFGKYEAVGDHRAHAEAETEERLPERVEHGSPGERRKVRPEKVRDALHPARQRERADRQQHQDHEQKRHQDFGHPFDPAGDAAPHHQNGQQQEEPREHDGHESTADEFGEDRAARLGVDAASEAPYHGVPQVAQRPTRDHAVEGKNTEARQHAQPADERPQRSRHELFEGSNRVPLGLAPDGQFGPQDGQPDQRDERQVDQHERATTVFSGRVGKAPDVAQANGRAASC